MHIHTHSHPPTHTHPSPLAGVPPGRARRSINVIRPAEGRRVDLIRQRPPPSLSNACVGNSGWVTLSAAAAAAAADGDDEDDDGGVEPWETSFLRDSYTVPKQHTVPATQLHYLNEKHIF